MARSLSATAASYVATQYGLEPINVIEIAWLQGGGRYSYADRATPDVLDGRIAQVSDLDFVINITDGSDSAEITIVLNDTDGHLKNIIDTVDVHKRDVWLYQWFEGMPLADKFLIFQGEINSPITWNEGDRTLSFTVISKIEDAEIGFSIEEGQFPMPPGELIGKAWPLKFGTTINVPALRFTSPMKGVLSTGVGIKDFTLDFRIKAAKKLLCPFVFRGYKADTAPTGSLLITPIYTEDDSCALNRCETVVNLQHMLEEQSKYEFGSIIIIDGERFPQGTQITLDINGGKFTGQFRGTSTNPSNIFDIVSRKHPEQDEIGIPTDDSVKELVKKENVTFNCVGYGTNYTKVPGGGFRQISGDTPKDESRKGVESSEKSVEFYNAVPTSNFFWAEPGATVTLDLGEPIVYVTNILPETILNVAAYRNFPAGKKLVTVPKSFYTVRFADFGSYITTEIVLDKPLSRYAEGWEDELFITSTSTVGPNTVDIITWLIQKYAPGLSIDAASFAYVRDRLLAYPSDFPLLERKNILTVLQEIAFQARCAIYLRDRTFYLRYLPEQPAAVDTISESDVDVNTLQLFHTDTEEIVTKLVAEWKKDYAISDPNKVILRHNVKKYGTQEETYNFYIYRELPYVHKSATFWLIRKSNTWRQARFTTPINKLKLETFDGVDLTLPDIAPGTVRAMVSKADYNSDAKALEFEIWLPIKAGTQTVYDYAWPADIDSIMLWPTDPEKDAGFIGSGDTSPGFTTLPPAGHPAGGDAHLASGFQLEPCPSQYPNPLKSSIIDDINAHNSCGNGNGDAMPSDVGDTPVPTDLQNQLPPDSPIDPGEIQVGDGPHDRLGGNNELDDLLRRIAQLEKDVANAKAVANNANEASGGDGSGNQPQEPDPYDNLPKPDELDPETCQHIVNIYLYIPTQVYQNGFPHPQKGYVGATKSAGIDVMVFAHKCEAMQMVDAIEQQHRAMQAAAGYEKGGGPYPMNANYQLDHRPECAGFPPCEDARDKDHNGAPIAYERKGGGAEGDPEVKPNDYVPDMPRDPRACDPGPQECPGESA